MKAVYALPLLLACAVAGCTKAGYDGAGRHPWTQGGVLRVAIGEEPKNLNPLLVGTTYENFIDRLMFEPLISADPQGNPVPMLADGVPSQSNGGISVDGLTIRYHLRRDARWTDGVPVTARDVLFSWQAIENSNNNIVSRHGYDFIRSIETPNPQTVVVHLKRPFAPFVNTFFAESDQPYDIVPSHVLARYHDINRVPFDAAPTVSDGPFRFVRWQRGDRILLEANPAFFKGRPGLSRVDIEFIPDENSTINLLRSHSVDYIFEPSIQTYPLLRALPDARIVTVNVNGYEGMELNTSRAVLADARVRAAIAAAIDKAGLTRQLTFGQVRVATEDLPDWIWAFDPAIESVPFNPAAAKALLASAGWIPGPDGMARKEGRPMELLLAANSSSATDRSVSLLVQAALRHIGISVDVKYYPPDLLYGAVEMGGILHGGKFDLLILGWFAGTDPDNSSQFSCANLPPNGYNDTRYCNAQMDAAQAEALGHYDRPTRTRAYSKVEGLLARDNPLVVFWWQRQLEAISVDFHGFSPNPVIESWNAWQWSI